MQHTDIAVVGGGMVGASLALLLADALPNQGIRLLEASPFAAEGEAGPEVPPRLDARSTALAPTTVSLLQRLRIWSEIEPFATAIAQIHVSDRGQPGGLSMTTADNGGAPLGHVVENHILSKALLAACRERGNLRLEAPVTVACVKPKAAAMELSLSSGTQLTCQLAVIADGAESRLRRALHIDELVRDYHQFAVVANLDCAHPHAGAAYERFTNEGPMALLPIGGQHSATCAMVLTCARQDVAGVQAMGDRQFLDYAQSRFGYRLGHFERLGKRQYYPLKLRLAREQVRSGIVLMGNAAHFLHPVAGQGFNLAARDCARLADILRNKRPDQSFGQLRLLQEYERAQRNDQDRTVLFSHGFNELFRLPGAGFGALRGLGFLSLELSDHLRSTFIRQLSGRAFTRPAPILPVSD